MSTPLIEVCRFNTILIKKKKPNGYFSQKKEEQY